MDGSVLEPRRGVVRALVFPLSFLLFGLGFLGILVQREHRALHDLIAGTVVIYAWDARAARLRFLARQAELAPPPQAHSSGVTHTARPSRYRHIMIRKLAVEFLGTAILVFFAVGVATLMFGFKFAGASVAAGVVATALAFGLTLLALVYMIGPISGSHVNPAVTIGALLTGRIPLAEAVGYWIAQFAGGIVGALVLWGSFSTSPFYHRTITGLGTDGWGKQSDIHIGLGGAFVFEIILTALFVFIVLRVTSATANAATAAIAIGLTLTVVHLIGIPVTGTSVNPARSLGPALVVGGAALSQVWLFIVAPLIGGVLAAGLHRLLYREESIRLAPEAQQPDDWLNSGTSSPARPDGPARSGASATAGPGHAAGWPERGGTDGQ